MMALVREWQGSEGLVGKVEWLCLDGKWYTNPPMEELFLFDSVDEANGALRVLDSGADRHWAVEMNEL